MKNQELDDKNKENKGVLVFASSFSSIGFRVLGFGFSFSDNRP